MIPVTDFPGHRRVRGELKDHVMKAKSVLFLVDSNDTKISDNTIHDSADFLYDLFLLCIKYQLSPRILIVLNKIDIAESLKDTNALKRILINEMYYILVFNFLDLELKNQDTLLKWKEVKRKLY